MFIQQQIIILISEGSCDTKDWRNDAGNSALHQRNTFHFIFISFLLFYRAI